ncbi:hypothetical protein HYQ03_gp29 [Arthrobacter phage Kuleana]|uniref:Uncharacterized protein n=1 Tax=Arthrobacter phage Kuleana TaxID=2653270 RepID=A0A5Q2WEK4_9CAUD|nr:hypothetical protein HYQ03_gp29 [Arthrobacter phage Kuleana]QGH74516.1 hypothetical protein SEA_KULEANA_29 [Arthrobacter phage Kuleana]
METYTTTATDGRTLELEIVQAAPYGYAVNFHQMNECVGKLYFDGEGYRVTAGELEINLTDGEKKLGTFADKWDAIAAIVANLAAYLDANDAATHDPADADDMLLELLDPEVYGDYYGPAARRDILRRAAYDLAITDRRAHENMLPTIARRAADMIRTEMEPTLRQTFKSDLAEILECEDWTADHRKTSYEHRTENWSFSLDLTAESVKLYTARPNSTVETLTLDRERTSAERAARIILAVFED